APGAGRPGVSRPSARLPTSAEQEVGEDDGAVVLRVPRPVDERHRPRAGAAPQLAQLLLVCAQLLGVASAELVEPAWVVAEPAAELGARGELPRPGVQARLLARHATWPEPVDEDPVAVPGLAPPSASRPPRGPRAGPPANGRGSPSVAFQTYWMSAFKAVCSIMFI